MIPSHDVGPKLEEMPHLLGRKGSAEVSLPVLENLYQLALSCCSHVESESERAYWQGYSSAIGRCLNLATQDAPPRDDAPPCTSEKHDDV